MTEHLSPCPTCNSDLCGGSAPHADEWDAPAVERANLHDEAAQAAAHRLVQTDRCAECGSRLRVGFQMVYQSGWRVYCTEDVRHEGTAPLQVEVVDASMLAGVA